MIGIKNGTAKIDTANTTLLLKLENRPEILYYGPRIRDEEDFSFFGSGTDGQLTTSADDIFCGACVISSGGDGSNRETMLHIVTEDGAATLRPVLCGAEAKRRKPSMRCPLPASYGETECLILRYKDEPTGLEIEQCFSVFAGSDVMAASVRLRNTGKSVLHIRRCMSLQLDLGVGDWEAVTFDGASTRERVPHRTPVAGGSLSAASFAGLSSNVHNPFVILREKSRRGGVVACNLIYSGNHRQIFDLSPLCGMRLLSGINDYLLDYSLAPGEVFESPEAVFVRAESEDAACMQMRAFVAEHILRGYWKNRERPILINSWESFLFSFDKQKLLRLCRRAAAAGIELFVLDDGWFGERDNDSCSLGDWKANERKLGGSLRSFADDVRACGLQFGIWMEPEMVSRNSDLFRAHPEYALTLPGREPMEIRRQIVLDLTKPAVRSWMIGAVSAVIEESGAVYVKWDCNRGLFDLPASGELFYRYTLGLYEVLDTLTKKFPQVLFESCASGGNRFDLGMLCFTPQIWASDNTDARSRLAIQEGTLCGYPQSAMGAHVGTSPNPHTFDRSSMDTRFTVASAGAFGYELDITALDDAQCEAIRAQTDFYKKWRKVLQFGDYYRTDSVFEGEAGGWIVVSKDKSEAVASVALTGRRSNAIPFRARFRGLDPDTLYRVRSRPQKWAEDISFTAYGDALCNGNLRLGCLFNAEEVSRFSGAVITRMFTIERVK